MPTDFLHPKFASLLEKLRRQSADLDRTGNAPENQFQLLADADVLRWVIPIEYGGSAITDDELTDGYERLASECLTTTFVLTQRNGACQRIANSENRSLKSRLLPRMADGEVFPTVGISHLTTSRQYLGRPAVVAEGEPDGFRLTGSIPWVTGTTLADIIVAGATCEDGRQLLAAVSTASDGVELEKPARMLSLNASHTGAVSLDHVFVSYEDIIAGPIEGVMSRGSGGGAGGLTTSALALGAARGSINGLEIETEHRPELQPTVDRFLSEYQSLRDKLLFAASATVPVSGCDSEEIRRFANSLVTRAAQAFLAASKGAGFVQGHPAERAVRESMFFYVWSCPQPVLAAALTELSCGFEDEGNMTWTN